MEIIQPTSPTREAVSFVKEQQESSTGDKCVQEGREPMEQPRAWFNTLCVTGVRMTKELQGLLTPNESVLALIDYQPQMFFCVGSHERQLVLNNAVALAKAARLFDVPVILTTTDTKTGTAALLPEIRAVFSNQEPIERTTMNSWEDRKFKDALTEFGRKKIILAGLWTEICVCFPSVDAIAEGYEVHVPTDACADLTIEAHERAVQRAIQAGVVPMTTLQVMFEWQRDWARSDTYDGCMAILKDHSAYGDKEGQFSRSHATSSALHQWQPGFR